MPQKITAKKSSAKRITYAGIIVFIVIASAVYASSSNRVDQTTTTQRSSEELVESDNFSFGPGPAPSTSETDSEEKLRESKEKRLTFLLDTYEKIEGNFYDKTTRYSSPEQAIEVWAIVNGFIPFVGSCIDNPQADSQTLCWYMTEQGYELGTVNETMRGFRRVFVDFDDGGFWVSDSYPTKFGEDPNPSRRNPTEN